MGQELIDQADMYVNSCARQQEKFSAWQRWGCPWRWEDCEAAFLLCREAADYWDRILDTTRRKTRLEGMDLMQALAERHGWELSAAWDDVARLSATSSREVADA